VATMRSIDGKRYAPVGWCIYCGSADDLTDEHTFAFGLGGTAILPQASCKPCAKITGKFEQEVLRGMMQQVRVFRGIKSRTKHRDAPRTRPIELTDSDGDEQFIDVAFTEPPVVCAFPVFEVPGFVFPAGYRSGIQMKDVFVYAFGPPPDEAAKQLGAAKIKWQENLRASSFAKMLAKIAYASFVGEARESGFEFSFDRTPCVVSSILGKTDEIGRWVGTLTKPFERHGGQLHRVNFAKNTEERMIVAEVQLFADSGTPHYGVILGEMFDTP